MVDVEYIKKRQKDGWSIRKIARQLEVSRQTVRKVLASPAEPPRYRQGPQTAPVMGPYMEIVERWLAADQEAPRKQRHTAKRAYDRLVSEYGFRGSEVTVRRAVRALKGRRVEVFVPLEAVPGKVAQADFGQATVLIAGRTERIFLFCLRAKHSRVPFAVAYPTEKLEASLGMGQRLGIATALLGDPATLLLDEPANGLDPEGIHWIRNLLKGLAAEGRTVVFVSSHLMSEMAVTAERLIVIGQGRLVADTTVSDFVRQASKKLVRVRSPQAAALRDLVVGPDVQVESSERGAHGGDGPLFP